MSKVHAQWHSGEDRDLSYYRGVKGKILWQEKHVFRKARESYLIALEEKLSKERLPP